MRHLAFVTNGEIDLRSFTTFGFNSKPNTESPIGFFGTGLKIATAVIARMGCRMTVLVDGVHHEFYTKDTEFRGKTFQVVRMRKRKGLMSKWQYQEMPYTTELGKNWEPWQVLRELESNTRDENGHTLVFDDKDPEGIKFLNDSHKGKTVIIVNEPSIVSAYDELDTIFLPNNLELVEDNTRCQAFSKSSKYLYYRGMRVVGLNNPSAFTYNIICQQRLTEDRTLYSWTAQWEVRSLIMMSENAEFIEKIVKLEGEKHWEGRIEFDDFYATASQVFNSVVQKCKEAGMPVLPRISTFFNLHNVVESSDPNVTATFRRSEWEDIYEVIRNVDVDKMAEELGWTTDDKRFNSLQMFIDFLSCKL